MRWITLSLLLIGGWPAAQTTEPTRAPMVFRDPVKEKNFYLLALIEKTPAVRKALTADTTLDGVLYRRRLALSRAIAICETTADCYAKVFRWRDDEIAAVQDVLSSLYRKNSAVRQLVDGPARASGMFSLYHDLPGDSLLTKAWRDAARALNNIVDLYGGGASVHPPDAPGSDGAVIRSIAVALAEDSAKADLFFQTSLDYALHVMAADRRDEAGRFEPLHQGENAAAFKRVKTIEWSKYPYSAILTPGDPPANDRLPLSPMSRARMMIAAKRYRDGKAPFIIVSGGFVRPDQTPYGEALEMKEALIRDFGIPEEAIIVDPHAQTTATKIRNPARLIYRYGMPFGKKVLVATDEYQSEYLESKNFSDKCLEILGYLPYANLERISPLDLEMELTIDALHADALDPLDP